MDEADITNKQTNKQPCARKISLLFILNKESRELKTPVLFHLYALQVVDFYWLDFISSIVVNDNDITAACCFS
jgi:hypothetical protein